METPPNPAAYTLYLPNLIHPGVLYDMGEKIKRKGNCAGYAGNGNVGVTDGVLSVDRQRGSLSMESRIDCYYSIPQGKVRGHFSPPTPTTYAYPGSFCAFFIYFDFFDTQHHTGTCQPLHTMRDGKGQHVNCQFVFHILLLAT